MITKDSSPILNVLIIGCGNIAGGFDMGETAADEPCTHMGAYSIDKRFNVIACIDPDDEKRKHFANFWKINFHYRNLVDFFNKKKAIKIDIVSICTPTAYHKPNLLSIIQHQPKLIFCEKPVSEKASDTKELITLCEENNILLAINYTRRWDPEVNLFKQAIINNEYGELRSVSAFYNKGILNNGSHLIDILDYLIGDLHIIATAAPLTDYSDIDPTIPALLVSSQGTPIQLNIGHHNDYTLFEIQFVFSKAMITILEGGLKWSVRNVTESKRFSGYRILNHPETRKGQYQLAMKSALNNIYCSIFENETLCSSGTNAYKAQKLCEEILSFTSTNIAPQ